MALARLFISYSRKDEPFARKLASALSALGVDIWIDVEDIPAGMNWSSAIQQGLDVCEAMIVIVTPDSAVSRNVEEEWQYYRDQGKPFIPVLLRPTKVHYQISRAQYVDFHTQDFEKALKQLIGELRRSGVAVADAETSSLTLPPQAALPVRNESQPGGIPERRLSRGLIIGVTAAVMALTAVAAIALSGILNPGTTVLTPTLPDATTAGSAATDTPGLSATTEPSQASVPPEVGVITLEAGLTLTRRADETSAASQWTPTWTPSPMPTDDRTATLLAFATDRAAQTSAPLQTATIIIGQLTQTQAAEERAVLDAAATAEALQAADVGSVRVSHNREWTLHVESFDGAEMVLVPAGCFMMGSDDGLEDEQPAHEQCFDAPFWIDRYEVTNAQFAAFSGVAGRASNWTEDSRPRENITWFEARDFCVLRGARLPTEREWEYAARGPDNLIYPWGIAWDASLAVSNRRSSQGTASAGSLPAGVSWVGAFDLSGNVWEWVSSLYLPYDSPSAREVESGTGTDLVRALRGGAWDATSPDSLRAGKRAGHNPGDRNYRLGFRCASDS